MNQDLKEIQQKVRGLMTAAAASVAREAIVPVNRRIIVGEAIAQNVKLAPKETPITPYPGGEMI